MAKTTKKITVASMCDGLVNNGGMIKVYRENYDGTATECLCTFVVDSVRRYLKGKALHRYHVTQGIWDKEAGKTIWPQ